MLRITPKLLDDLLTDEDRKTIEEQTHKAMMLWHLFGIPSPASVAEVRDAPDGQTAREFIAWWTENRMRHLRVNKKGERIA